MEVEIKARAKSHEPIKRKLRSIGARYVGQKHQIDRYYEPYHRPMIKKSGRILRVRHDALSKQTRLELHISRTTYAATEHEVVVSDLKTIRTILKELKAREAFVVDKRRSVYRLGRAEIVLDTVKGLGQFIEIEIQGKDSAAIRQRLHNILAQLGVGEAARCHDHYNEMIAEQKGKKHAYF